MAILLIFLPIVNYDTSLSLKYKKNIIGRTGNDGTRNIEIWVPLRYLSNFCRILEITLIHCESNPILTWFENCMLMSGGIDNEAPTFAIADTKRYVSVVILSTQENVKLLDQLKSDFKRTINWNKYNSKVSIKAGNQYFN